MQVIARRSHAACHSFFTLRRATWVCALRSTALVFTRACFTQSKLRGMPRLERSGRPFRVARGEASSMDSPASLLTLTIPERFFSTDIWMFPAGPAIRGFIGASRSFSDGRLRANCTAECGQKRLHYFAGECRTEKGFGSFAPPERARRSSLHSDPRRGGRPRPPGGAKRRSSATRLAHYMSNPANTLSTASLYCGVRRKAWRLAPLLRVP